jgi:hypothetical protein
MLVGLTGTVTRKMCVAKFSLFRKNGLPLPYFAVSSRCFAKIKDAKQAKRFPKRPPVELVSLFRETEKTVSSKTITTAFLF